MVRPNLSKDQFGNFVEENPEVGRCTPQAIEGRTTLTAPAPSGPPPNKEWAYSTWADLLGSPEVGGRQLSLLFTQEGLH